MNQEQWESLGFERGDIGYVKPLPNGNQLVVTEPETGDGPFLIGLYKSPAIEDADCFAYATIGSNFSSNHSSYQPLDSKYIIAVINALIETMR
jgi:hypothetical protein